MRSPHRRVGILGGMGPAATADFYDRLIRATPATTDQDHLPVAIWADPSIPDRVAAIRGTGPSPVPELRAGAQALVAAGTEVLVVACNTVHPFIPAAVEGLTVEWISMIEATVSAVRDLDPPPARVGLLATSATLEHGMYDRALTAAGMSALAPSPAAQDRLLTLIKDVKTGVPPGELAAALAGVLDDLAEAGADAVVVACTEVSVVAEAGGTELAATIDLPVIDASEALARATVATAYRP